MIPASGLLVGVILALAVNFNIPEAYLPYAAVGILACLDSVFGGTSAMLRGRFRLNLFISGFFGNAILAVFLVYIGNLLNFDLSLAAVLFFGTRMFQNLAIIRRNLMNKLTKRHTV